MPNSQMPVVPAPYRRRIDQLFGRGHRVILGLVGAPGSGKSSLAAALHALYPSESQVVPMDGFHLANVELARLNLRHCKGAPQTFDSGGYVELLTRLRKQKLGEVIYAPEFRRDLEEPIAGAIPVLCETRLIIAEGNYLLLSDGRWSEIASLLDESWYVDIEQSVRIERLTKRHEQFGKPHAEALQWIEQTDEPNARLIESTRARATLIFDWRAADIPV